MLVLPGFLIVVAVPFCCLYMLPLMTDKGFRSCGCRNGKLSDGCKGQILEHVVFVMLYMGINALGGSVFIGVLFSCPLANVFWHRFTPIKTGAFPEIRP
ncbi:MAG: hypothetical protein V1844_04870 [Pseudomonadota bacterium]